MRLAGWDEYHANNFMKNNMEWLHSNATIKEDASDIINKLKSEGNKIIIITSRSSNHYIDPYKVSEKWLKQYGIEYDKLIVNGSDKACKCIENDIDVLIDDQVGFLQDVSSNTNTKVLMFDSPYNKECNEFKRVYSWQDVYDEIKKM